MPLRYFCYRHAQRWANYLWCSWLWLSKFQKINLIFVDTGIKINIILPWRAADWAATARHTWDLWQVLYLPARQLRLRDNQPSGMGDNPFHFTTLVAFQKSQIWAQVTTKFWGKCSSGSTTEMFMSMMNWSGLWYVWHVAWSKHEQWQSEWHKCLQACIHAKEQQEVKVIWQKAPHGGAHSPVRGHPRGSKVVPLNSWGRVSY